MNDQASAVLLCCRSDQPDQIVDYVYSDRGEVVIGRPNHNGPQPDIALDPLDENLNISQGCHARVRATADGFMLVNEGRFGTQLYERRVEQGDEPVRLELFDYFSIPALPKSGKPHYKFLFLKGDQLLGEGGRRLRPTLSREPIVLLSDLMVQVYDTLVELTDKPYALLKYLYDHSGQHCYYEELFKIIWPNENEREKLVNKPNAVDQHVLSLARKLRTRKMNGVPKELGSAHCFLEYKTRTRICLRLGDSIPELRFRVDSATTPRRLD